MDPKLITACKYMNDSQSCLVDTEFFIIADARQLSSSLSTVGSSLVVIHENLVDKAWGAERPLAPKDHVIVQPIKFAGQLFLFLMDENTLFEYSQ